MSLRESSPSNARALNSDTCHEYNVFRLVTGQRSYGIRELWTVNTCVVAMMRLKRRDETDFQEHLAGRFTREATARCLFSKSCTFSKRKVRGKN